MIYTLGIKDIIYALKTFENADKLKYLSDLSIILTLLKIHIRISYKYKYISTQNYNTWSEHINEISNMLGGWIVSCQKK